MSKREELYKEWIKDPKGLNVREFSKQIDLDKSSAYRYIREFKEDLGIEEYEAQQEDKHEEEFLNVLKKENNVPMMELCDRLGMIPRELNEVIRYYRSKGFEIGIVNDRVIYSQEPLKEEPLRKPIGDSELIFGIATDLHFGSKGCQITALNEFGEACRKEGVTDIFCPGDVTAGVTVYRGQHEDIYAFNPADQEDSCVVNLPHGFRWWMIGGNHDYDAMKQNGHNVIKSIAHKREDVNYLGFDQVLVPILYGVDIVMWHPSGGVPYALSYRLQKGIEDQAYAELMHLIMGIKEKPSIRFFMAGHLHVQFQAMFGSIFGVQCGAFEGTTNYLKRKGHISTVGGYIIKATLDSKGRLKEHEAKFKHYIEIENDYMNYKHKPDDEKTPEKPIFEG